MRPSVNLNLAAKGKVEIIELIAMKHQHDNTLQNRSSQSVIF